VTGKREIEGHYIRVEVVTREDDHFLLYYGSTIWGFEHACRVARTPVPGTWEHRNRIDA
jgi:hypothetical protein